MKPRDDYRNGDEGGSDSDEGSEGGGAALEEELSLFDADAPARALNALNALRKSRQHFDVVLVAGGAEVPAHRALLAAASPYLLSALGAPASPPPPTPAAAGPHGAPLTPLVSDEASAAPAPTYRVEGVDADALRDIVEYMYTGRLVVREPRAARRLYLAAWRLRVDACRAHLADRLLRRLAPHDCLETRALPDLPPAHLRALDAFIAERFDEVCGAGALAGLPLVRMELLRATSADGGEEAPAAVAAAALAWLRAQPDPLAVEELCSRPHLVYVDAGGSLRDCGELPAARGDAPELQEYRRQALDRPKKRPPPQPPRPLPGLELGARNAREDFAVLAARGGRVDDGAPRVTRALLSLGGKLVAARIAWRDVGEGGGAMAVGGPLGGAREPDEAGRRAPMATGRCAHGLAVVDRRIIVCGGYDRARVLRSAEAYCARDNAWQPLPDMRTARARFPAAILAGRLFAVGGSDGQNELDSVDVYEEKEGSGAWRTVSRLPLAASHCGLAADEARGALWVVGGWAGGRSLKATHRYCPARDEWSEGPPLGAGRSQCACVAWDGWAWALGGCDAWHCIATTEKLPLDGNENMEWQPGPPLPTARRSVGGCVWRGRLVSAGGSDGASSLRKVDWLEAGASGWAGGPDMRRARAALGLAVLDDVLYAVGGFDGKEFLSCVECLYEPSGEWTTLMAPPAPRKNPALANNTAAATDEEKKNAHDTIAAAATDDDKQNGASAQ